MNVRGPLFFGAVDHIEEELRHHDERHPGQNHLVLRLHGVDICDLTGIEMLESTVKTFRERDGDVYLVRPRRPVRTVMEQSGFLDLLGPGHVLEQEGAIEYLFHQVLDPAVCIYECEHRVFAECQALEKHPYGVEFLTAPRKAQVTCSCPPTASASWPATLARWSSMCARPPSSGRVTSPAPSRCRYDCYRRRGPSCRASGRCCSRAARGGERRGR